MCPRRRDASRISNPPSACPGVLDALQALGTALARQACRSRRSISVHLHAGQINGCAVCVDMHARARGAKNAGEADERLFTVTAWREAPYFSDAERAALALTEAATRLADRADPSPTRLPGITTSRRSRR